jgi:hypothetical protein
MSETPRREQTEREARLMDARSAANWAMEALKHGRYELAAGLTGLAARAQRAALQLPTDGPIEIEVDPVRSVPLIGTTRDEQPARPPFEETANLLEQARTYADLDQTATLHAVPSGDDPRAGYTPESTRCRWIKLGGNDSECWAVIYLDPHSGWHHLDPELDKAHPASPTGVGPMQ